MSTIDSGEFLAVERAGKLFEETIHQHMNGGAVQVEVGHIQVADASHTGGFRTEPVAFIDGKSAMDVYVDTVANEEAYSVEEEASGADRFNRLVTQHWESTVAGYSEELPAFVVALDSLARTVYRDRLFENATGEGVDDLLGLTQLNIYEQSLQNVVRDVQTWQEATTTNAN